MPRGYRRGRVPTWLRRSSRTECRSCGKPHEQERPLTRDVPQHGDQSSRWRRRPGPVLCCFGMNHPCCSPIDCVDSKPPYAEAVRHSVVQNDDYMFIRLKLSEWMHSSVCSMVLRLKELFFFARFSTLLGRYGLRTRLRSP